MVATQEHEELVAQRSVVLAQQVGQVKVCVNQVFPFGVLPIDVDVWGYLGVPFLVDVDKVVLADAHFRHSARFHHEVLADELT